MNESRRRTGAIGVGSALGVVLGVGAGVTLENPAIGIALGVAWALAFSAGMWTDRSPATTAHTDQS